MNRVAWDQPFHTYADALRFGGDEGPSRSFRIVETSPRLRQNPAMDFTKVIVMIAGAIAVGFLYDRVRDID